MKRVEGCGTLQQKGNHLMSDEYSNNNNQINYEKIYQASQDIGKQLDEMLVQVKQFQEECEKNRQELNRLKEDYQRDREKTKEFIEQALRENLAKMEQDIAKTVTLAIQEKAKSIAKSSSERNK